MRNTWVLAAALLLTIAPAVLADSIQLPVNSSVRANIFSPDDDFWGKYTTTPGINWDGYIGDSGQVDIPYTVQLDVPYSTVSEPSTFVLLGTGILFLAVAAYRKSLFHP
jgi:hypothetical protein